MAALGPEPPHVIRLLAACSDPAAPALVQVCVSPELGRRCTPARPRLWLAVCVQELAVCSVHELLHGQHVRPQYGALMQVAGGCNHEGSYEATRCRLHDGSAPPPPLCAEDVAAALAHCHARGVIHRDLSSRNVLLGPDGRARLADFGLSVMSHSASEDSKVRSMVRLTVLQQVAAVQTPTSPCMRRPAGRARHTTILGA